MPELTPLDQAHAQMQVAPDDLMRRHRFYQRLADAELILLLDTEPGGTTLSPQLLTTQGTKFALAFDSDERLAEFVTSAAPTAAMSGRAVVGLLAGQGIGLGLNLGVAPSSIMLPSENIDWMADMLAQAPNAILEQPTGFAPPQNLPDGLVAALTVAFSRAGSIAAAAYLLDVRYASGKSGKMLAVVDVHAGAGPALTQAINDALVFSSDADSGIDVGYFAGADPVCRAITGAGLQLEMQAAVPTATTGPVAPGMDPDKPPRLF